MENSHEAPLARLPAGRSDSDNCRSPNLRRERPTGTPLNVRTSPNGAILGALYNGAVVQVLKVIFDKRGRSWALVVPLGPGKQGWVFGAFLTCGR
jgi:hypothetical protein